MLKISFLEYAPSFGEMGMAIKEVVDQSSLRCSEVTELSTNDTLSDLQLTPAQQLVLSCVWLNIKVLCNIFTKQASAKARGAPGTTSFGKLATLARNHSQPRNYK